jgi:hypothetical protein
MIETNGTGSELSRRVTEDMDQARNMRVSVDEVGLKNLIEKFGNLSGF